MKRPCGMAWIGGVLGVLVLAGGVWAANTKKPAANDAPVTNAKPPVPAAPTPPKTSGKPSSPAEAKLVFDHLLTLYGKMWDSPDWLTRCLASLSIARLPQAEATVALVNDAQVDKFPIVSLVSWEAVLSRAAVLDAEQFKKWVDGTPALFDKKVFNGTTRVDLLRVMAAVPPDARWKTIFSQLFSSTNSLRAEDIWVLDEMGHCLAEWKSPDLVEALISQMRKLNNAYRAEYILQAAGCPVAWAGNRMDQTSQQMWDLATKDYVAWWQKEKPSWVEKKAVTEGSWRKLKSTVLAANVWNSRTLNLEDNDFRRREMEIKKPDFKGFDVAFVVDATGSMRAAMDWLADDITRMMTIFGMMSMERRIGLTFYRDPNSIFVAKTTPLTGNSGALVHELTQTEAFGGGDVPESVYEGLSDCLNSAGWNPRTSGPKVIVLVGDAPPHPQTQQKCEEVIKSAMADHFTFYAVKVMTPMGEKEKPANEKGQLPAFDTMAKAAKTEALTVDFAQPKDVYFHFPGTIPAKTFNLRYVWVARPPSGEAPSRQLVTRILFDCVTAQFRDRMKPLVPILLEACASASKPEERSDFDDQPPARGKGRRGGGGGGGQ